MKKHVLMQKQMILTSEQHGEHQFASWNTQHPDFKQLLWKLGSWNIRKLLDTSLVEEDKAAS